MILYACTWWVIAHTHGTCVQNAMVSPLFRDTSKAATQSVEAVRRMRAMGRGYNPCSTQHGTQHSPDVQNTQKNQLKEHENLAYYTSWDSNSRPLYRQEPLHCLGRPNIKVWKVILFRTLKINTAIKIIRAQRNNRSLLSWWKKQIR